MGSSPFSILNGASSIMDLFQDDHSHTNHHHKPRGAISSTSSTPAVDILDTPKDYIFYVDVPGLSKSDIKVTIEDENTLVIRSSGKRKREDDDSEDKEDGGEGKERSPPSCKYIRLERKGWNKFIRKFRLPENSNVSAISAKCENGVLIVTVEKLPPPPKPKTVQVTIS